MECLPLTVHTLRNTSEPSSFFKNIQRSFLPYSNMTAHFKTIQGSLKRKDFEKNRYASSVLRKTIDSQTERGSERSLLVLLKDDNDYRFSGKTAKRAAIARYSLRNPCHALTEEYHSSL